MPVRAPTFHLAPVAVQRPDAVEVDDGAAATLPVPTKAQAMIAAIASIRVPHFTFTLLCRWPHSLPVPFAATARGGALNLPWSPSLCQESRPATPGVLRLTLAKIKRWGRIFGYEASYEKQTDLAGLVRGAVVVGEPRERLRDGRRSGGLVCRHRG